MAPFTVEWLLGLHKEIFGRAWPGRAGKVSRDRPDFGIPRRHVMPELVQLCEGLPLWDGEAIRDSAEIHFRLVRIHPFHDGNGRWARLASSIWLKRKTTQYISWPSAIRESRTAVRDEYLTAVEAAVNEWNLDLLAAFHRKYVAEHQ